MIRVSMRLAINESIGQVKHKNQLIANFNYDQNSTSTFIKKTLKNDMKKESNETWTEQNVLYFNMRIQETQQ